MPAPSLSIRFTKDSIPLWRCPACLNETLELVPGSFFSRLSAVSLHSRDEEWYGAEHQELVFSCMLECNRDKCRESVAVSGNGMGQEVWDNAQKNQTYQETFQAKYFEPPLPVFHMLDNCPRKIKDQLKTIAALLPVNTGAAGNALRITLELLLDELEIPRYQAGDATKHIPLGRRIADNKEKLGANFEMFDALKDVGNHSSHTDGPIRWSHIEDACTILDDFLQRLFGQTPDYTSMVATLKGTYGKKSKSPQK